MLVLFCMRGCGRIARPAFPAPSDLRGQDVKAKLKRNVRRDREAVSDENERTTPTHVIARLAAFAKASAGQGEIACPVEALAQTGLGDPVFQRRL